MEKITRLFSTALWLVIMAPVYLSSQTVTTFVANAGIDDALTFDQMGNLYGSHYLGTSVFKITPNGVVSTYSSGFNTPNGLAFDASGNLFMADNVGNRIYKILPDGTSEVFVSNFPGPSGLLFEHDSDTLIATSYTGPGSSVAKIAPDGTVSDFLTGGMSGPVGLAYDNDHNLYVAEFGNANASGGRKIFKVTPDGELSLHAQLPGGGSIGFIAFCDGYLYATMIYSHKIYRIGLDGSAELWLGSSAGNTDGDAATAKFNSPNGITANATQDTLYISDFNTRSIRMVTNLDGVSAVKNAAPDFRFQVSPNPAASELALAFSLPSSMQVEARLLAQDGSLVREIINGETLPAGNQTLRSQVGGLPMGIYYCQMVFDGNWSLVKKLVVGK